MKTFGKLCINTEIDLANNYLSLYLKKKKDHYRHSYILIMIKFLLHISNHFTIVTYSIFFLFLIAL